MTILDHPRPLARDEPLPSALKLLFWAFSISILLRIFVTENVLNLWMNYTTEQGSIFEKIHIGSYLLVATCVATLLTQRIELDARDVKVVRAILALLATIGVLCALMAASGRADSAGYLIDNYAVACLSLIAIFAFPPAWRAALGDALLLCLVASAVMALAEAALKIRILPYPAQEATFRPTGLSGHPLALGLSNAVAIALIQATSWSSRAKAGATLLFLLAAVAAGARLAMIAAAVTTLAVILMAEWPRIAREQRVQLKGLVLIGAVLILPVAVAALAALGLLDRFQNGLFDESAMARVSIYKVFDLVGWKEILWGGDISAIRTLAFERFELEFIESSLVIFVFQFGLIGAAVFLAVLARVFRRLVSGAPWPVVLGTVTFLFVALSNNSLSSKTPSVIMFFMLIETSRCAALRRRP